MLILQSDRTFNTDMRAAMVLGILPLIGGCHGAPPAAPSMPLQPYTSGATLYVLETTDDFLDDVGFGGPPELPSRIQWLGEQALQIALRAVSRGRSATLVSARHFDLKEGETVEFPPDQPVHSLEKEEDGRFRLREWASHSGFGFRVKAILSKDEKYVDVEFGLTLFRPDHQKLPGTSLEAGEPVIREQPISSGTFKMPIRGTVLVSHPRGGDRSYAVLLHVASVTPAGPRER